MRKRNDNEHPHRFMLYSVPGARAPTTSRRRSARWPRWGAAAWRSSTCMATTWPWSAAARRPGLTLRSARGSSTAVEKDLPGLAATARALGTDRLGVGWVASRRRPRRQPTSSGGSSSWSPRPASRRSARVPRSRGGTAPLRRRAGVAGAAARGDAGALPRARPRLGLGRPEQTQPASSRAPRPGAIVHVKDFRAATSRRTMPSATATSATSSSSRRRSRRASNGSSSNRTRSRARARCRRSLARHGRTIGRGDR